MLSFISNEKIKLPNMIYGTAWKKESTAQLVTEAIQIGFRGVDTACQPKHYREDLVGVGLKNAFESGIKREDIFIQTKFTPIDGQDRENMPYSQTDDLETQVAKSFAKSKENLGIDFIDSYVLHSPLFPPSNLFTVWNKMSQFYKEKQVGQLGISNCYDVGMLEFLYRNCEIKPSVVQNRFYAQSTYDKDIRKWCNDKGIIYQSFWSLTANPHLVNSEVVYKLSQKYSKTLEQIFYKYLNQVGIIPLNGTTNKVHMIIDLQIGEFSLEENEVAEISALL